MMTLGRLSELVSGCLNGGAEIEISNAASIARATENDITFVTNEKFLEKFIESPAAAAVVPVGFEVKNKPTIVVENVEAAFSQIVSHFRPQSKRARVGISPRATISPTAIIADDVDVYPGAFIGDGVEIGFGSVIYPNVTILDNSKIGAHTQVFPSATIYPDTVIGDRCIVHAGVVLGAYGFGYKTEKGTHKLTAQLGNVVLENDVEVGANTTIDRGTYESTIIGEGTKLDDQVMIGHNCRIGKHNLLCSQVGIAGSCTTGDRVVMAGQVGIGDHIDIGNDVTLIAKAGVMKNIEDGQVLAGAPAMPVKKFFQLTALFQKLPEFRKQLKRLGSSVEKLEPPVNSNREAA